jgi:hypothetical protein
MKIAMKPVDSSSIAAHGYDAATKTLAVQFKSGGKTYHYAGVSPQVVADLKKAKSVGSFVHAHVAGKFKHSVVA